MAGVEGGGGREKLRWLLLLFQQEQGWRSRLVRGLRCVRSRVRSLVIILFSTSLLFALLEVTLDTLKTEHWWREGGKISASSTSSLSVITVTSYRHKIWLLYLFLSFLPPPLATATQAAESYLWIHRTIVNQQTKETFAFLKICWRAFPFSSDLVSGLTFLFFLLFFRVPLVRWALPVEEDLM